MTITAASQKSSSWSQEENIPMVQVEAGQWHSLEVLEEGTVVFEAKDGKYEPMKEEDVTKLDA